MMPTAMTTAVIMMEMSLAMPTAVMTESSEKMMSSTMIWPMTARERRRDLRRAVGLFAFELVVDLDGRLPEQEQAAADEDEVAAREAVVEDGEERLGEAHDPGERQQQQDAHAHRAAEPERPPRAGCCSAGSLPTRIEMKMTLSTPSTTSRNVSVSKRDQPVGCEKGIHGGVDGRDPKRVVFFLMIVSQSMVSI